MTGRAQRRCRRRRLRQLAKRPDARAARAARGLATLGARRCGRDGCGVAAADAPSVGHRLWRRTKVERRLRGRRLGRTTLLHDDPLLRRSAGTSLTSVNAGKPSSALRPTRCSGENHVLHAAKAQFAKTSARNRLRISDRSERGAGEQRQAFEHQVCSHLYLGFQPTAQRVGVAAGEVHGWRRAELAARQSRRRDRARPRARATRHARRPRRCCGRAARDRAQQPSPVRCARCRWCGGRARPRAERAPGRISPPRCARRRRPRRTSRRCPRSARTRARRPHARCAASTATQRSTPSLLGSA